jgi:sRNA-binding carbon storage regulator CsrA
VHRQEIYDEIQKSNQAALTHGKPASARLPSIKSNAQAGANNGKIEKTGGSA